MGVKSEGATERKRQIERLIERLRGIEIETAIHRETEGDRGRQRETVRGTELERER